MLKIGEIYKVKVDPDTKQHYNHKDITQQKSDNLINTKSHNKRAIDEMFRKGYHIPSHLLAFMTWHIRVSIYE